MIILARWKLKTIFLFYTKREQARYDEAEPLLLEAVKSRIEKLGNTFPPHIRDKKSITITKSLVATRPDTKTATF
jgi:hypothetical protein